MAFKARERQCRIAHTLAVRATGAAGAADASIASCPQLWTEHQAPAPIPPITLCPSFSCLFDAAELDPLVDSRVNGGGEAPTEYPLSPVSHDYFGQLSPQQLYPSDPFFFDDGCKSTPWAIGSDFDVPMLYLDGDWGASRQSSSRTLRATPTDFLLASSQEQLSSAKLRMIS